MSQVQTVTVFMDAKSRKNLESQGINVKEMLALANRNFLRQGIRIRYDLKSFKIKAWPGVKFAWQPEILTEKWLYQETDEILERMQEAILWEFNRAQPDVVVLFAGHLSQGDGRAFPRSSLGLDYSSRNGKGVIVAGTHFVRERETTKKRALDLYAGLIMHEHGHLYGLDHVEQKYTVMYPSGTNIGVKFDKRSRRMLQRKTKLHRVKIY